MHYNKELFSYKECAWADGLKIREQDQKMKDMERRFKANKTLLESNFYATLLESADAAFERGHQPMASLYSEAAHEFDGGKGVFLPDWEVVLRWVDVLEQRKANRHARQKEELCQEVLRSRAGIHAEAHTSSPTYAPEEPPEGEAGGEQAEDYAVEEEEESRGHRIIRSVIFLLSYFMNILKCFRSGCCVL